MSVPEYVTYVILNTDIIILPVNIITLDFDINKLWVYYIAYSLLTKFILHV